MINIDDINQIKNLDKSNVLESVQALGKQCRQAWENVNEIVIKNDYSRVDRVVVAGMGGSALGAEIIKALYFDRLKIPFEISRGYHLPRYVDQNTLVILSSYSGTTEEILSAAGEAENAGAKIMAISAGGELEKTAIEKRYDFYKIRPDFNPSGQPRMALGYSIFGILGLLKMAGIIDIENGEIEGVTAVIEEVRKKNGVEIATENNLAKQIALKLENKIPLVLAAEHLAGNAKTFCNSINENAKTPAMFYLLPEANHHLLESLKNPAINKNNLIFLLFLSDQYEPAIKKRFEITEKVIEQNGIEKTVIQENGKTKLEEVMWLVAFGNWVIFYLAMIYGVDPATIPWVDYFKNEMKK
ncbi:MAG: bifunctional phosphoglucose/phosphomannose isomerase [Candidatus Shapirobacteria bacterium]